MKLVLKIIAVAACLSPALSVYACPVTVENNTREPIAIAAHDGNQTIIIQPGKQMVFGSHMQHAQFYVMKAQAAGDFRSVVSMTQHFCSPTPLFFTARQLLDMDPAIDRDMFTVQAYTASEGQTHSH